ncbi:MAG TPA: hypothetical protein VKX17_03455 [Planctomycetota bacterium]|nr:hypothetical protein [Planctomycetota bacterium]
MRVEPRYRLSGLLAAGLCSVLGCARICAEEPLESPAINTAAKTARRDVEADAPAGRARKNDPPLPNDPVFGVVVLWRDARDRVDSEHNAELPVRGESQSVKSVDWRVPKEEPGPAPQPIPALSPDDPEQARIAAAVDESEAPAAPVKSVEGKESARESQAQPAPLRSRLDIRDPEAGRMIEAFEGVEKAGRIGSSILLANNAERSVSPASTERSGSSILQNALIAGVPEAGPRIESGSALDKDDPKPVLQEAIEKRFAESLAKLQATDAAPASADVQPAGSRRSATADAQTAANGDGRAMKLKTADAKNGRAAGEDQDERTRELTLDIAQKRKRLQEAQELQREEWKKIVDAQLGGRSIRDEDQLKVFSTLADTERRTGAMTVLIFDAKTRKPMLARVSLRDTTDAAARAPLPEGFWCAGVTPPVRLVSGPVRVEISHGGRFFPSFIKGVEVKPGQVTPLEVPLARPMELDFEARGWVTADLDIGIRKRAGENSIWFGPAPTMADLVLAAKCEGVRVIGVTLPLGDEEAMAGVRFALEHPDKDVLILPVFPGPRNRFNGTGMGLGVTNWDDLKTDTTQPEIPLREGFENIRMRGGLAVFKDVLGSSRADIARDIFPVYGRLKQSGYFGQKAGGEARFFAAAELPFDTVTHAYDLLAFDGSEACEQVWFNLLNENAPVRVIGAGGGSLEGGRIPYGQTFIQIDGAQREFGAPETRPALSLTREKVLDAISSGRTMVSFGPAVFARVFERDMGPGSVLPPDGRELQLQIQAYSTLTAGAQLGKIEIIRNGQVVYTHDAMGETEIHDLRWPLRETHDSWYLVRVTELSKNGSASFGSAPRRAWTSPIFFRAGVPIPSRLEAGAPVAQTHVHGILRRNLTPMRGVVTALAAGMPTRRVETGPDGAYDFKVPASATLIFEAPECEPVARRIFEHPNVQRGVGALLSSDDLTRQLSDRAAFGMWRLLLLDLEWDVSLAPMEIPVIEPERLPEPK